MTLTRVKRAGQLHDLLFGYGWRSFTVQFHDRGQLSAAFTFERGATVKLMAVVVNGNVDHFKVVSITYPDGDRRITLRPDVQAKNIRYTTFIALARRYGYL